MSTVIIGSEGRIIVVSEIFAALIDSVDDIIEPWVKCIFEKTIVYNMSKVLYII